VLEERDGQVLNLQMAVREFAPPSPGKPRVYLAAAVHIGNDAFYKDLQKFLDAQDVVLFEGVKPPGAGAAEHETGTQSDSAKAETTGRKVRFLAMAVERFRKKNGRLPESLKELGAKKGDRIRTFKYGLLPFIIVLAPVIGLIFFEPNLSMALLVALLAGVVLFTAGARIGHFLALGVVATPLLFGAVASAQYRLARVVTFLNPGSAPSEATWQVHQSLVGIGAGRLFGVGLGQGQQKLGYLTYAYSDFIFSTIGEEWGFLGVLTILVLFGTFVWLGFRIARRAGDSFGQLLAVGLTGLIGITAALHIGVSLALLPATGITLPFISYGRSSLFVALVATGVLISIGRGRRVSG
jgi:hypothetical protein